MPTAAQAQTSSIPATQDQPRLHLGYLDSLRALAAIFVVLHHFWIHNGCGVAVQAYSGINGLLTSWLLYGHLAVDVFIVLSGFCLMMPVVQNGSLRGGALNFYRRRCRRILPPLFASLILFASYGLIVQLHKEHRLVFPQIQTLVTNGLLLQDILPRYNTINGVTWSVAAEWKIYFFLPLLIWVWQRRGIGAVLVTGTALGLAATAAVHGAFPNLDMAQTCPWYLFLFALGVAGAAVTFCPPSSLSRTLSPLWPYITVVLSVLLVLLWRYPYGTDYDLHLPLIDPVAGLLATLVLMALTLRSQSARPSLLLSALSWPPLVFVGSFSYSIYLVHILFKNMAFSVAERLAHRFGGGHAETLIAVIIGLPLVLGAAYLFHLAFERPFMTKPGAKIQTEAQAEAAAIVNPAP